MRGNMSFNMRRRRGERMIANSAGYAYSKIDEDDREAFASDAVSDILTALFGPAGGYKPQDGPVEIVMNRAAIEEADEFLSRCLRSYEGDAEDYELEFGTPGQTVSR